MTYAFLITLTYFTLLFLNEKRMALPDGQRYFVAGLGTKLFKPFYLRWLLPFICKQNEAVWNLFTILPTFFIPILVYVLAVLKGYSETQSLIACALTCGLSGVVLVNYLAKYLTDGFGMFCMLVSVISFQLGMWWFGILFSLIGTMANEKVFLYSALVSWNPLALLGGVALAVRYFTATPAKTDILGREKELSHPFRTGWESHKGKLFTLTNWGVVLIGLADLDFQTVLTLAVGYGSIFLATDSVRLYQWAFIPLVFASVRVMPIEWGAYVYIPIVVWHWFSSRRYECV